jgi:hypothetical protein
MKKLIVSLLFISGLVDCIYAQSTAIATATATLVTPISITKNVDMNFGNLAVSSTDPGTVVLLPNNTRNKTGGVSLPATTGTVSAASFTVSGENGYSYTITLPSSLTISSGGNSMTVNTFTSTPSNTGTLTGGTSTLNVGATLNVAAGQASGTYTSGGGFTVTVNYN